MAYIDTSVLTAYYCPEPMSQKAQAILRNKKPTLSSLTELELFSAVAKKVRTAELAKTDAHRIIAQFSAHVDSGLFVVVAVENQHWRLARGWLGLFSTALRTLDALHLAIASCEELELVTSDKVLYQAGTELGVMVQFLTND